MNDQEGQLQTSISIKLLPCRWWIASQHWIAMDIPCRWESTQHPSRSWHLHPIQQARSLLVHHLFGKVPKAVGHGTTFSSENLRRSVQLVSSPFWSFWFPRRNHSKNIRIFKKIQSASSIQKMQQPTPPRTASKRGRLEFQEPGWSKPSMEAAKTCSNTWKLPRDASNPSMMDYPLAITDLGHRLSAE